MSRISAVAASAVFVLVLTTAPAQAAEVEVAPVTPGIGVVAPGGGASTQGIWTWVCQALGLCQ